MVGIFKVVVSNVRVCIFLGAGIVFAESCQKISGSLINVVAAAKPINMIDHIGRQCGSA